MSSSPLDPTLRRRRPAQARSRATVDRVCDAASALIAETGWDRVTTNAVAAKAGVSITAVYAYFPDKYALVHEVLLRAERRRADAVAPHIARFGVVGDWRDAVCDAMTAGAEVRRTEPATVALRAAVNAVPELKDVDLAIVREQSDAFADGLLRVRPDLDREAAAEHAYTLILAVNALMDDMTAAGDIGATRLANAQQLAVAYLESVLRD